MYAHEMAERKANPYPMCTELPTQHICQSEMKRYLEARQLDYRLAHSNGWYESFTAGDEYRRVVIPAVTHKAGHVYWQARDIFGKAYIRYQCPKGPRHEALIVVHPDGECFGSVIAEGPMDALAAAGEGYYGIALMGMVPSQATLYHLALLLEEEMDTLVVLDRDSANAGIKIVLWLASQQFNARMVTLPGPEKDLAECLPAKRKQFLSQSFRSLFT